MHHGAGMLVDTAVMLNLDWLQRAYGCARKNLPVLQRDLEEAMKSKHQRIPCSLNLTMSIEIDDTEIVALADIQCAIKQLDKFNKLLALMPNACAAAAVQVTKLGKEEKNIPVTEKKHQAAGRVLFRHPCVDTGS